MSLHIAQVCADRGIAPGGTKGASLHLRGVAAGFGACGHSVTTYSRRPAAAAFPAEVHSLDALGVGGPIDVIYERYSLGHLGGLVEARRRGVPFVLEVNAPLVAEAMTHRPDRVKPADAAIERQLLAGADLVVVVSTELERWVSTHRSDGSRPTIALANGFEPEWFAGPTPERTIDLAFIGHPKPWHGAERIPSLLANLVLLGHDTRAVVIGGGDAAEALALDAARLGVADRLEVTGALPPAEAAYRLRQARIGLAPYRTIEPFYFCPLKVIDYLAAGVAIVASRIGDIPELVGDAGVLVEPDDDHALARAVSDLLASPATRVSMATAGRARAFERHTWTAVAERTLAAVEALTDRSGVPAC